MRPLLLSAAFLAVSASSPAQDTLTLYQPVFGNDAYLVDGNGNVAHTWSGSNSPGMSVYLMPDGDLMRSVGATSGPIGSGGGLERVAYDGTVEWQYALGGNSAVMASALSMACCNDSGVVAKVTGFITVWLPTS